jgi:hypothetical protein
VVSLCLSSVVLSGFIPCKVVSSFENPRQPQKLVMAGSLCSNVVIEFHYVWYENYEDDIDYFVVKACL